jgi:hypothetical protein
MKPLNNYIGIGIEEHNKYKFIVVIIFATNFERKKIPSLSKLPNNY